VAAGWEDDLLERLRARLPGYMVPTALMRLDHLPITVNGKLDVHALPALVIAHQETYRPPRNAAECGLAEIWADLLDIDAAEIGLDADIFALGAHSMLMMRLTVTIRSAFGVELTLRTLFDAPRLETMAAHINSAQAVVHSESTDLEQVQW